MHWPCPCQRRFREGTSSARTDADAFTFTDGNGSSTGDCPRRRDSQNAYGAQRGLPQRAREWSILRRWNRLALYAYGRKRLHVLASALGEILKVYKSRRLAVTSSDRGVPRRRTFLRTFPLEYHWFRFACHAYKEKCLGQLAGALLTYFQELNQRRRIVPSVTTTRNRRR